MIKPPCKGCEERYALCHTTCEKYIGFKTESERLKKAKAESRRGDFEINNYKKQIFKHQGNEKWG